MKRTFALISLIVCAFAAIAGQVCTIDPPRPAGSAGLYIVGSKLFDLGGTQMLLRGVNRTHWDQSAAAAGIPLSGANAERIAIDFTKPPATSFAVVAAATQAGLVAIPGNWKGTGSADPAVLATIVDTWIAQASTWTALNATGIVNVANEWGPQSWTQQQVSPWAKLPNYVWRDSYVVQVPRMRAAGYTGLLMIDAPNSGQDAQAIVRDGAAILAADPLHNLVFSLHIYGGFHIVAPGAAAGWQQDYAKTFVALKASGLPIVIGEFGPGRSIGPSPTTIPPEQIIADAEANGFGWLAWAWDDNNLANCGANDLWFSMTTSCGKYTGLSTELTTFGQTVVPLFKSYGATRASLK